MNGKKKIAVIILSISLTFLGGCAYFQKSPSLRHIPKKEYQKELQQITSWIINGVLSVTHDKKRDIARFKWEQQRDNYIINISGPLNINSIRIVGDSNGVEFWRTRKKCIRAQTPEQLTLDQLGWQLPISNIRYWILALPVPNIKTNFVNFDQYDHLVELIQSGWQIKYLEFQYNTEKNLDLPKVIELTNKEIIVKIKITNIEF